MKVMIISTQTPTSSREQKGKVEPGKTGQIIAEITEGGFASMHRDKNFTESEREIYNKYIQSGGWVVITGHGAPGQLIQGEYRTGREAPPMDITCSAEDYVNLIMSSGNLEPGKSHINVLLSVCYAAQPLYEQPSFAVQLAVAFSQQGISSHIIGSVEPVGRVGDLDKKAGDADNKLRFRANKKDIRVFDTEAYAKPIETRPYQDFYITSHGLGFENPPLEFNLSKTDLNNLQLISREEAEKQLKPNEFLIRLRGDKKDKFAISYKAADNKVTHWLIENQGQEFIVDGGDGVILGPAKTITELGQFIKNNILLDRFEEKYPNLDLNITNEEFNLQAPEAKAILTDPKNQDKQFIIRASSKEGSITLSYKSPNGIVSHIPFTEDKWPQLIQKIQEIQALQSTPNIQAPVVATKTEEHASLQEPPKDFADKKQEQHELNPPPNEQPNEERKRYYTSLEFKYKLFKGTPNLFLKNDLTSKEVESKTYYDYLNISPTESTESIYNTIQMRLKELADAAPYITDETTKNYIKANREFLRNIQDIFTDSSHRQAFDNQNKPDPNLLSDFEKLEEKIITKILTFQKGKTKGDKELWLNNLRDTMHKIKKGILDGEYKNMQQINKELAIPLNVLNTVAKKQQKTQFLGFFGVTKSNVAKGASAVMKSENIAEIQIIPVFKTDSSHSDQILEAKNQYQNSLRKPEKNSAFVLLRESTTPGVIIVDVFITDDKAKVKNSAVIQNSPYSLDPFDQWHVSDVEQSQHAIELPTINNNWAAYHPEQMTALLTAVKTDLLKQELINPNTRLNVITDPKNCAHEKIEFPEVKHQLRFNF